MKDLLSFWKVADKKPLKTDCFVVLSYAVKNYEEPNKLTKSAVNKAYNLWIKCPESIVILSTGDNQGMGISNAKIMEDYAIKVGIAKGKIVKENTSINTYENLLLSKEIIRKYKLKNPTIIAHDLHMRRVVATIREMGWENFFWISSYSKGDPSYGSKRLQTYSRLTVFSYEVLTYIYSRVVGWV
jgi:uncharacterized SAM-binding protein YcdF (DUF218 family)